jgi:hypothetical protein
LKARVSLHSQTHIYNLPTHFQTKILHESILNVFYNEGSVQGHFTRDWLAHLPQIFFFLILLHGGFNAPGESIVTNKFTVLLSVSTYLYYITILLLNRLYIFHIIYTTFYLHYITLRSVIYKSSENYNPLSQHKTKISTAHII